MNKFFRRIVILGALTWSGAAGAVTSETAVNVSNAGTPIAGATVSIKPIVRTAPRPASTAQRRARVAPPRVTTKSDGTYVLRYDDEVHRGMLFDVTVRTPSGQRRTIPALSIDQIRAGIDVASPGGAVPGGVFPSSPGMPLAPSPSVSLFGLCNSGSFGIVERDTISGLQTFESTSRGNLVEAVIRPYVKREDAVLAGCLQDRPTAYVHVGVAGEVFLCCQDYFKKDRLGDLTQQSLREILASAQARTYLEYIYGGRESPADFICKRCELAIYRNPVAAQLSPH